MGMLIALCYCVYKIIQKAYLLSAFIASGMFVDISTFWISIPALIFFVAVNSQRDDDEDRHRAIE